MQALAILLLTAGLFSVAPPAQAQKSDECKLCREVQLACLKNHTRDACNTEYDICMKHCRKR
jgi:hypothetical protein